MENIIEEGKSECTACNGTGVVGDEYTLISFRCAFCGGDGIQDCAYCGNQGYSVCYCGGSGRYDNNPRWAGSSCRMCDGSGRCPGCD